MDNIKDLRDELVFWKTKIQNTPMPEPIEKDGEVLCPFCGEKVYRSPEVEMSRPLGYIYYCKSCIYHKRLRGVLLEKAEVDYEVLKEKED